MEIANNENGEKSGDETTNHQRFNLLQSGLKILTALAKQIEDDNVQPRLDQARSHLAKASREVGTAGFDRSFSKAMRMVSSVAVANGYDELTEDALKVGGGKL